MNRPFAPGDQPPQGYIAWHGWAEVQRKAGIKQSYCVKCCLWRTPQEACCKAPRLTLREFNAMVRRYKRPIPPAPAPGESGNRGSKAETNSKEIV